MAGGDFQDQTRKDNSTPNMKCSKFPAETVRKVYSRFDGSSVRTMCAECLFQEPEFVQANKSSLYDVPTYLDRLARLIKQDTGSVENLRQSVPSGATEFLEKGKQISDVFSQFSVVEFTKLRSLVMMHTDKIRDMVDLMIEGYKKLFDEAEATVKKNVEHVMNEIEQKYQLASNITELDREKLISHLQSAENPAEYLRNLEYQLQPTQFDKGCIDAYIGTLLHKSEKVLENPPKVSLDSGLELKLNQLVAGVAVSLAEIDAHIKSEVLHNLKITDLSKQVSFKPGLWTRVSPDGLCGKLPLAETAHPNNTIINNNNNTLRLRLANKLLSPSSSPLVCLCTAPDRAQVAAGSDDGQLLLFDADLGDSRRVGVHPHRVSALVGGRTTDGRLLLVSGCVGVNRPLLVAAVRGQEVEVAEVPAVHGPAAAVSCLALVASPGTKFSRWVVSGGSDGSLCVIDLQSKTNSVVFKTNQDHHGGAVKAIKEVSNSRIISAGKTGTVCLWSWKTINQQGSESQAIELELIAKIDRKQTIQNLFSRTSSETDVQVIIQYQGSKLVEVIDMVKLVLEKQFELPTVAENVILLEHLYKDGRFDFVLLDTAVPGEPTFLGDTTSPRFNLPLPLDPIMLSQGALAAQPSGPRVQIVPLNKKSLRLAKIAPTTLGVSCINFYDIEQA